MSFLKCMPCSRLGQRISGNSPATFIENSGNLLASRDSDLVDRAPLSGRSWPLRNCVKDLVWWARGRPDSRSSRRKECPDGDWHFIL